jgi:hypothetical protein
MFFDNMKTIAPAPALSRLRSESLQTGGPDLPAGASVSRSTATMSDAIQPRTHSFARPFFSRLSKTHTRATAVLVDEFDAGGLERAPNR